MSELFNEYGHLLHGAEAEAFTWDLCNRVRVFLDQQAAAGASQVEIRALTEILTNCVIAAGSETRRAQSQAARRQREHEQQQPPTDAQ